MRSRNAASFGAISVSTAWNSGVFIDELHTPYTPTTCSSSRSDRSRAARVFSKVAGAGSAVIRSMAASWAAMPASRAGSNCSTFTWSKGGTPPKGPVHGARRGFCGAAAERSTATAAGATGIGMSEVSLGFTFERAFTGAFQGKG